MNTTTNTDRITTSQAAAIAGVHPRTIKRWHVAGMLTGYRNPLNGNIRYSREQLLQKINSGS